MIVYLLQYDRSGGTPKTLYQFITLSQKSQLFLYSEQRKYMVTGKNGSARPPRQDAVEGRSPAASSIFVTTFYQNCYDLIYIFVISLL